MPRKTNHFIPNPAAEASLRSYGMSGRYQLVLVTGAIQTRDTDDGYVREITASLKAGDGIPAPIVTPSGKVLGTHRRAGWEGYRPGEPLFAFVLDEDYDEETILRPWDSEFNNHNGYRPTAEQNRSMALTLIGLGRENKAIARATGLSNNEVAKLRRNEELTADLVKHFEADDEVPDLTPRQHDALAAHVATLSRETKGDFAQLAYDAGLKNPQISAVSKELHGTSSEQERADILTRARAQDFKDAIVQKRVGGIRKPWYSTLPAHLAGLSNAVDRKGDLPNDVRAGLEKDLKRLAQNMAK